MSDKQMCPTDIHPNDWVRDPMTGKLRQVDSVDIETETMMMKDGGMMGTDEVSAVFLPSEVAIHRLQQPIE